MELLLKKSEILDFGNDSFGTRIFCRQGQCWLTQSGDHRDHILGPGDGFNVRSRGRLIVTATEPCQLLLTKPGQEVPQGRVWKNLHTWVKICLSHVF